MRKSSSCVRKNKLWFCDLNHLVLAILGNSSNLVNLGKFVLAILANFHNALNWVLALFANSIHLVITILVHLVNLVNLINLVFAILANLVHLVHLASWILDILLKLDMFHYTKDKKLFDRR